MGHAGEAPAAERRQLTVVFCDLVGSTRVAERLDPEAFRDLVTAFHDACADVIRFFDGHVAQYLGDGLLVYFGYPRAHEDDPQRAVRTARGIVEATARLNARLALGPDLRWAVRLGIDSGLVVVGDVGAGATREQLAVGEAPNTAARLQELAQPNTVLISAATYSLIQGFFECEPLGPTTLRGFSRPVGVYRVLGDTGSESRFDVAAARGLTPLVGRNAELARLLACWEEAKQGRGQVVLLSGEPGIGKSRLVRALRERLADEPHRRLEFRCSSYHDSSAFYPVIDLLTRLFGFTRDDAPAEKLDKLQAALAADDLGRPDAVPLFASLLSVPSHHVNALAHLTPERRKQMTMDAVGAALLKLAEREPILVAVEDLHWVDPSTLELLGLIVDKASTSRLLVVCAVRPHFTPPWTRCPHLSHLGLDRLSRAEVAVMIDGVAGGKPLPEFLMEQLITTSDGVPLFVEECAKTLLESGLLREEATRYELAKPLPALAIPATLHDWLMARLDGTGSAKSVAQLGAVVGRQFSFELIHAVSTMDETALQAPLRRLVQAGLLYQEGIPPEATYRFKHALIQDAARGSLLKSTRQDYHRTIAAALEKRFPEVAESQPELVAYHCAEAGLLEQAIAYLQRAARRANERSANVEAVSHLTKALDLLARTGDTPERPERELTVQIALGIALVMTKGYAADDVARTYERARALCRQLPETPQLFPTLWGLWMFYVVRSALHPALETAEQLLRLAGSADDPGLLVEAQLAMGITLYHRGDFLARAHLEQSLAGYDPEQHRAHRLVYGQDPGVLGGVYLAHTLWLLGYADQALTRNAQALALTVQLGDPYTQALARGLASILHDYRRDVAAAREQAEITVALSTEYGFPFFEAMGTILLGSALAQQEHDDGIDRIHRGLAAYQALGAKLTLPHRLALLAGACAVRGRIDEGLRAATEGITLAEASGDVYYVAELYRLKGELCLKRSASTEEAEDWFHRALETARRQQARSLELRAAVSLVRLSPRPAPETVRRLRDVCSWFTEGLGGRDLEDARALLAAIEADRT